MCHHQLVAFDKLKAAEGSRLVRFNVDLMIFERNRTKLITSRRNKVVSDSPLSLCLCVVGDIGNAMKFQYFD